MADCDDDYSAADTYSSMKREADGDMGTPQKRSRPGGDTEVRLLIPSKAAGSIIGKGGHNITKLRTEYKASVTVPDCPGPERGRAGCSILTVCSDLETVLKVVRDVIPNIEDAIARTGLARNDDVDLRLLVHQSQAGCIIGKAGQKIKELREKTGARIKIFSNCCPQSTDRVCQISGRPNTCVDSLKEIIELVKTSPIKGINNPYDPHNYDDFFAQEYGGFGDPEKSIGVRGGPPPPMPGGRGGRFGGAMGPGPGPRLSPRMGGPPPAGMGPRGPGGGFGGRAGGFSRDFVPGGAPNGMMNNAPMMGGEDMAGPGGPMMGGGGGPKGSTQVTIPKDLAGAIIGKGGARIRKIRSDSGAGITIDEPLAGSNDRIITITGSPSQIQMAQYLLQQSALEKTGPSMDSGRPERFGGGGRGGGGDRRMR
ncbi:heterogeneous nuclear ribonucleoprotein K-like isoform X2 [Bacillus rossius redtenbacheri]|uniref:heterogeneous nuclear ribonucleoprotein K-like isoform X2 n=1 Tax=Bacillus rossius redtenbacheri TaxID=93214 RepID=UPI002FDDCE2F